MIDLAIVGSGPAALTAAIYAARAGLEVVVYEKNAFGGALTQIAKIENFPGFVGGGVDLAENLKQQATSCGAIMKYGEVKSISKNGETFQILVDEDNKVEARAVLVATGSEPIPLAVETKVPVSYCAICDGALYKGKNIAVVGGGNAAIQESLHLADLVKKLSIFSHSKIKAEPYLVAKLKSCPNVNITENHEIKSGELDEYDGIFVFIGTRPATTFLPSEVLDEKGYIEAENCMTKITGLFAAGDVRANSIKQAVTAAADGAEAALKIINYLKDQK